MTLSMKSIVPNGFAVAPTAVRERMVITSGRPISSAFSSSSFNYLASAI